MTLNWPHDASAEATDGELGSAWGWATGSGWAAGSEVYAGMLAGARPGWRKIRKSAKISSPSMSSAPHAITPPIRMKLFTRLVLALPLSPGVTAPTGLGMGVLRGRGVGRTVGSGAGSVVGAAPTASAVGVGAGALPSAWQASMRPVPR